MHYKPDWPCDKKRNQHEEWQRQNLLFAELVGIADVASKSIYIFGNSKLGNAILNMRTVHLTLTFWK